MERTKPNNIIRQSYFWIMCLLIVSLFFSNKVNSLCIIALLITWLLERNFRDKCTTLLKEPFFLLNAFLLGVYIISIVFSDNKSTARFFVEKNLSLLILPMVLLSKTPFMLSEIKTFGKIFISATFIVMAFCTLAAAGNFRTGHNYEVFFYHALAGNAGISAIIASFFCLISIACLLSLEVFEGWKWLLLLIFSAWLVLLSSKLFIVVLLVMLLLNIANKLSRKIKLMALSGIILLAAVIAITNNPVRSRFEDIGKFNTDYLYAKKFNPGIYFDGLSLRLVFIRFGLEIMQEDGNYLFGVGTGDAETLLQEKIRAYDMYTGDGVKDKLGYLQFGFHNEFLQKFLQTGIVGLGLFLSVLVYCIAMAVKHRSKLLLNLMLIYLFSFFTDTIMEVQTGLVIFLTFAALSVSMIRMKERYNNEALKIPVQA